MRKSRWRTSTEQGSCGVAVNIGFPSTTGPSIQEGFKVLKPFRAWLLGPKCSYSGNLGPEVPT